jgi:hypothetical protein
VLNLAPGHVFINKITSLVCCCSAFRAGFLPRRNAPSVKRGALRFLRVVAFQAWAVPGFIAPQKPHRVCKNPPHRIPRTEPERCRGRCAVLPLRPPLPTKEGSAGWGVFKIPRKDDRSCKFNRQRIQNWDLWALPRGPHSDVSTRLCFK